MRHVEKDLRAFIGPHADYYVQAWSGADPSGGAQVLRWNWPAFFLNIAWLLHRRMYDYFWVALGAMLAIGAVAAVVAAALRTTAPTWLVIAIGVAIASWFGAFGTWLYCRHAASMIDEMKAHYYGQEAIVDAGGVRWRAPAILLVVLAVLGAAAVLIVPKFAE